jgi:hypothetical protein
LIDYIDGRIAFITFFVIYIACHISLYKYVGVAKVASSTPRDLG